MATVIAIDYGHKKIGFAVGQTITSTASPLSVVMQNGDMWRQIDEVFLQWRPEVVVIGEPKLADGKEHPLEKMIERFSVSLNERYNITIYRENEALTSFEASCNKSQGKRRQQPLDAHAAAIFLESWLRSNVL